MRTRQDAEEHEGQEEGEEGEEGDGMEDGEEVGRGGSALSVWIGARVCCGYVMR